MVPALAGSRRDRRGGARGFALNGGRAIAGFDSASAMVRILGVNLDGREAPLLAQLPPRLEPAVDRSLQAVERLPPGIVRWLYARSGWLDAVPESDLAQVRSAQLAEWVVGHYHRRRYPVIFIGSSNGALLHLAAALGAPWLPQTLLLAVRHGGIDPDDPCADVRQMTPAARILLDANPDLELHHMHDPCQDRLMIERMTYFRVKWLRLPNAYRDFLADRLEPGGAVVLVDCGLRWPTTAVGERHVFQFGAPGGATIAEFQQGGERVADFLRRHRSSRQGWEPPRPDGERPEAEWGFAGELTGDIESAAGDRLRRLSFAEPEDASPLVADLFRTWYAERGLPGNRLLVSSFLLLDPMLALRTASVPYWSLFSTEPSVDRLAGYLDDVEPYDRIGITAFPHGLDSIGLAPVARWQGLANRARHRGELLGVRPAAYPHHFRALSGFHRALRGSPRVATPALDWPTADRHLTRHAPGRGMSFS